MLSVQTLYTSRPAAAVARWATISYMFKSSASRRQELIILCGTLQAISRVSAPLYQRRVVLQRAEFRDALAVLLVFLLINCNLL